MLRQDRGLRFLCFGGGDKAVPNSRSVAKVLRDHQPVSAAVEHADADSAIAGQQDIGPVAGRVHQALVRAGQGLGQRQVFAGDPIGDACLSHAVESFLSFGVGVREIAACKHVAAMGAGHLGQCRVRLQRPQSLGGALCIDHVEHARLQVGPDLRSVHLIRQFEG